MREHQRRQLAAVMFADIVGYTALMQEDEQLGIETRTKYQKVLQTQHEAFGGTIVQYYGDGALTMFPNSVDAIRCAVEIQKECRQRLAVPVRIGIHMGNVIVESTGLIGDAVNIASRIESFGLPGGVLVSDSVHDQVKNQPQLGFVGLGKFKLKNVGRPFEIFAISTDGLEVPSGDFLQGKGRDSRACRATSQSLGRSCSEGMEIPRWRSRRSASGSAIWASTWNGPSSGHERRSTGAARRATRGL